MNIIFLDAVQDFGGSQKSTISLMVNIKDEHKALYVDFWGTEKVLYEELEKRSINFKILDKKDSPIIIKESGNVIKTTINMIRYGLNMLKLKKELNKVIDSFSPDLIIVNNTKSLTIIKKGNFKIIFFERTWFANSKIKRASNRLLDKVDYFFAVSNATKNAIYIKKQIQLDKIFVLHNSIEIKSKRPSRLTNEDRTFKILNIGGYIKTKGLHLSLEIAKKLKDKGIDFHMDVVGALYKTVDSQMYYDSLLEYIIKNKLTDLVSLHYNIKDMSPFYSEADVLIHPTHSEGLPRVIMEAMAHSVPVISNSVGGVNDFIIDRHTGILTDYNDVDDYVNSIMLIKNDKVIRKSIVDNAYNMIKTSFNHDVQINKLKHILNKI